ARQRRGSEARIVLYAAAAAVAAGVALIPVALPYVGLSAKFNPQAHRSWDVAVVEPAGDPVFAGILERRAASGVLGAQSAELQSYAAPAIRSRSPWRPWLERFGTPEGHFFPGVVAFALAAIGLAVVWRGQIATVAAVIAFAALIALLAFVGTSGLRPLVWIRQSSAVPLAFCGAVGWTLYRSRRRAAEASGSAAGRYVMLAPGRWMFSVGPTVRAFGVPIAAGIYPGAWPPFSFLRVPARFGVLWLLAVAILAGVGMAWLLSRAGGARTRALVAVALLAGINVELWSPP